MIRTHYLFIFILYFSFIFILYFLYIFFYIFIYLFSFVYLKLILNLSLLQTCEIWWKLFHNKLNVIAINHRGVVYCSVALIASESGSISGCTKKKRRQHFFRRCLSDLVPTAAHRCILFCFISLTEPLLPTISRSFRTGFGSSEKKAANNDHRIVEFLF